MQLYNWKTLLNKKQIFFLLRPRGYVILVLAALMQTCHIHYNFSPVILLLLPLLETWLNYVICDLYSLFGYNFSVRIDITTEKTLLLV